MKVVQAVTIVGTLAAYVTALEVTTGGDVIVRESEPGVLGCGVPGSQLTTCSWTLPNGVECQFGEGTGSRQCRRADNVWYNGTDSLCQIRVNNVKETQNGLWTCTVATIDGSGSESVSLSVGREAEVEWEGGDLDSGFTVHLKRGKPRQFGCLAEASRPKGRWVFHFGESHREEGNLIESETISHREEEGGTHLWNVSSSISLTPSLDMDQRELYCTYLQLDGAGREIFTPKLNLKLEVHALSMDPSALVAWPAKTGQDLVISLKFTALPEPSEVVWSMNRHEIPVPKGGLVEQDHYKVLPLDKVSEYEYEAKLVIVGVTKEDEEIPYSLRMINKLSTTNTITEKFDFEVMVDRAPLDPEGSSSMITIIIVVVLLILIIIVVAVILVVYAKKNNKWCFESSSKSYVNPDTVEKKEPLVKHHPYGRPSAT